MPLLQFGTRRPNPTNGSCPVHGPTSGRMTKPAHYLLTTLGAERNAYFRTGISRHGKRHCNLTPGCRATRRKRRAPEPERWAQQRRPRATPNWTRYVAAFLALRGSAVKTLLPASLFARSPGAGPRPGRGACFASGLVQRGRAHPEAPHQAGGGTGSPLLRRDDPLPSRASHRRLGATDPCRSTGRRASLSAELDYGGAFGKNHRRRVPVSGRRVGASGRRLGPLARPIPRLKPPRSANLG